MKNASRIAFCVLVVSTLLLTACVQKPQADAEIGWQGKEPYSIKSETSSELADRYADYEQKVDAAFTKNNPTAAADFDYEILEDGVRITAYKGKDQVVVIPDTIEDRNVISLGETAFKDALVRAVKVPDRVYRIEKGAFSGCTSLSTLYLPFVGDGGDHNYFGYIFGADSYEKHPTQVPASLDTVILGDRVTEIAENAFAGCKSLSAVSLSANTQRIGSFAFYECKDLVLIRLGRQTSAVGSYAFGYCSALYAIELQMVEEIGAGAFFECNALSRMCLPFVGGTATENRYLGYVFGAEGADYNGEFVPESLKTVQLSACAEIPDRAFADCTDIQKLEFVGSVLERVGVRAFYGCRSLTEIALPDSVRIVADDAFFGCDNLKKVDLGSGIEQIGTQAFFGCLFLESISIPDKVTEIAPSAFALCRSLECVELNKVRKVGKDAFWGCGALTSVNCDGIEVAEGNESLLGRIAERESNQVGFDMQICPIPAAFLLDISPICPARKAFGLEKICCVKTARTRRRMHF